MTNIQQFTADLNWAADRLRTEHGEYNAAERLEQWAAGQDGPPMRIATMTVLTEVAGERINQDAKWGEQNHRDGTGRPGDTAFADAHRAICKANGPGEDTYRDILAEEVYEAFAETDSILLRTELIQVAAVATAWIEAIDRRTTTETAGA